jgi:hypothetical protein
MPKAAVRADVPKEAAINPYRAQLERPVSAKKGSVSITVYYIFGREVSTNLIQ